MEAGIKEARAHVVNLADFLIRMPGVALSNVGAEARAALVAEVTAHTAPLLTFLFLAESLTVVQRSS